METFTVLPFLVAFMVGLGRMQALDIFKVTAWNLGIVKVEPWRNRATAVREIAATAFAWLAGLFRSRRAWLCAAAIVLAVLLAHAGHSEGAIMAIVAPTAPAPSVARDLREKREKLIRDAGDLMGANSTFETPEKRTQFDAMMVDIDAIGVQLQDADRADKFAALQATQRAELPESQRTDVPAAANVEGYNRALPLYLRGGFNALDAEGRSLLSPITLTKEMRDMSTFSGPDGGILVAPDTRFLGKVLQAMKFFGGMEAAGAEVFNTTTAGALPIPMGDDTGNTGAIVSEAKSAGHASGTSPTLTQLVLGGYLYSSLVIKVSWQMLRDATIDVEGYVAALLGERLARIQNTHFTTGTGASQPQGLTGVATVGRQSATGNTVTIPFDDVFRLESSVDVAYRNPKCRYMMSDATRLVYRLAKDGNGRYLWPELGNVQAGVPQTLNGYQVVVNNDMPVLAASAKHTTFGDHSFYKIRRIGGITLVRINEKYVEEGQVGFLAFQSADGGFADAGQHPVKLLQNSAS